MLCLYMVPKLTVLHRHIYSYKYKIKWFHKKETFCLANFAPLDLFSPSPLIRRQPLETVDIISIIKINSLSLTCELSALLTLTSLCGSFLVNYVPTTSLTHLTIAWTKFSSISFASPNPYTNMLLQKLVQNLYVIRFLN